MNIIVDDMVQYLEDSIQLLTKKPAADVSYEKEIRSNETLQKEVTVYNYLITLTKEQLEFLTREEGSALSALSHVVSVILQHHDIAGTLGFSEEEV
ncbi:MAG: hypothetical protein KAQ85_02325 [Thermodesulfovibrionia bacterium]|nr:hypothetical protein [Thermodesulfovibrionia bacterium]